MAWIEEKSDARTTDTITIFSIRYRTNRLSNGELRLTKQKWIDSFCFFLFSFSVQSFYFPALLL